MPRALRSAGALALALALLVLLLPATAAAAPRWLAPTDLTPAGEPASTPRVVIGSDGVATLAWAAQTAGGGVVRVATRPAGASAWSAPADLSAPGISGVVDLVVDPTGAAGVLWTVQAAGPAGAVTLHAAVRPAGAPAFGPAEPVSPALASSLGVAFTGDGAGGFVAAWSEAAAPGTPATVSVSTRPAGGAWSAPEVLSVPGEHALFPKAAGAAGRVAIVWTSAVFGQPRTVRLRERASTAQPWSAERVVSAADIGANEPGVAVGPTGEVLAAWFASTTSGSTAQAAFRPAGGDWGPPEALGPGSGFLNPPKAVIEPDGTASVLWSGGTAGGVVARVRPPGAGFGPLQPLSRPGAPVGLLPGSVAAAGSGGGVIVVWVAGDSPDKPSVVRAAVKPRGAAAFGPAPAISAPDRGLAGLAGALGSDGEGVAAWIDGAALIGNSGVLRVADHTERPGPVLEPSPVAVRIDGAPSAAVEGSLIRLELAVDGFPDGLRVRLQRHMFGSFRDTGHSVTLDRTTGELPVRLDFPGKGVFRLAHESQGRSAFSRAVTVLVSRPKRPLIAAGTRPTAVRVGFGSVWLLTKDDAGRAIVMRLDPRTGRPVGEPTPVDGAVGLAVGGGAVWVSRGLASDDGVVRLDPRTGAVAAEVPVISNGWIAAGPAGVWTVECVRTLGAFPDCGEQHLARIDTATNAVSQRITVVEGNREYRPSAGDLAVGARRVWFSITDDDGGRSARRLDVASGRVVTVGSAIGLVARGDVVWGYSGRSCALASATGAKPFVSRGRVAGPPRYGCGQLSFDGRSVWVSQFGNTRGFALGPARVATRVVRLDARTARPVGRAIPAAYGGIALDVGAGAVWAASVDEAVVRSIDPKAAARGGPSARPRRAPRARAAWHRPTTIPGSASPFGILSLDLATGGKGRAAAVWTRGQRRAGGSEVVSSIRPSADRGWTAARRLAAAGASSPTLDINGRGEGLVSWSVRGASPPDATVQVAALGRAARAWSAPTTVSEAGSGATTPQVAVADDGGAVALWSCSCTAAPSGPALRQAVRAPRGAFGPPAALGPVSTAPSILNSPRLAMAPGGAATAVWAPFPGGGLLAASRAPGAAFGDATALVPPAVIGPANATVAVNDAGQAVAAWEKDGLVAAVRGADGAWGAPQRIAPVGEYGNGPTAAIDAAGNALVIARAFDLETFAFRVLSVARRAGAGAWEKPSWLSPKGPTEGAPGPSAGEPSLAMNARGDAVVVWSQPVAGSPRALARLRPAGRLAWRPLEAVSGRERAVAGVSAAIGPEGAPAAAWVARPRGGAPTATVIRVATRPALRTAG